MKREAILNAALHLFTTQGFHGTPTSQIAKVAEVATGTLFHHFKTKEHLINTLYADLKNEMKEHIQQDIESETSIYKKIYTLWYNCIKWGLHHPEKRAFLNQFGHSPYITQLTKEEAMNHFSFVYNLLEDGQSQDIIKPIPSDLLHTVIYGLISSTTEYFILHPEQFEHAQHRDESFKLFWDCIKI